MAAPGAGAAATLLQVHGYDHYRVYSDDPISGGWRQLLEPVSGRKYWNHIALRLTTWSLLELLRLNGLEEFLLLGEWGVFAAVPEDKATYEDLSWGLELFANDRLEGRPVAKLRRGTVLASAGMPRPGVMEVLVPSTEQTVIALYAGYRYPRETGMRQVQRLPASERDADTESSDAVTVPTFRVLPWAEAADGEDVLPVTADRDPRSAVLGHLAVGALVGLSLVQGTRAQLSRVMDGPRAVWGGWIGILRLDATPTLERILEETESMIQAQEFAERMRQLDEASRQALADAPRDQGVRESASALQVPADAPQTAERLTAAPPARSKVPPEPMEQRPMITGGWRQVMDPFWRRPHFVEPLSGLITWGLTEVLRTGGLDDLLLARHWEICIIDPLAAEIQKDASWVLDVYADPGLSGEPLLSRPKGDLLVVQVFDARTSVATLLLPPAAEGCESGTGYARVRLRDGRPLLRALLAAPAREDGTEPEEGSGPEFPPGPVLEGPYFATPPGGAADLPVCVGQDVGSDRWARLPRGYCIRTFADVLGYRARLPDLEGGGWVSIFSPDGTPHFRRQPTQPPVLELPGQAVDPRVEGLPVVWPGFGVLRPPKAAVALIPEQHTLPDLLRRLGGGRAVCDWNRTPLGPSGCSYVYKSPLTFAQTTLDDLLRLGIWKATVVEAEELRVREAGDPRSTLVAKLPYSSLLVAEWVAPGNTVRLLLPDKPDAPRPLHVWADLGHAGGATLVPLVPGSEFWVEPRGGHLEEEEQRDPSETDVATVRMRAEKDAASALAGYLKRGDAVQLAEINGRCARVVPTKQAMKKDSTGAGGWIDVFDEAGWSLLKARRPGDVHPEELRRRALEVREEAPRPRRRSTQGSRRASTVSMPGAVALPAPLEEQEEEEAEEAGRAQLALSSEAATELPALLWKLGDLESNSLATSDWREAIDPVWGKRYYVNRWSGQIIHRLVSMGVACPTVRLTLYFSNLSIAALYREMGPGPKADKRLADIEGSLLTPLAALADVPEDMMEVRMLEGPDPDPPSAAGTAPTSPSASEDSIMGGSAGRAAMAADAEERRRFRVAAKIRAPGARASWASAGLKQAMADGASFTSHIIITICNVPHILMLRENLFESVELLRADLEEMDVPRTAPCLRPPPEPEPPPPPPVDDDIREMSRNMVFSRPALLQMPNRQLGPPSGNAQALADGLRKAPEPSLEEIGLWKCFLGDMGAIALAGALDAGCGAKLQTLLLDENRIAAAGATALGAGLAKCGLLRELGIARNPLGAGFAALVAGLGAALVVFDASDVSLDDAGAAAAAASIPRWPALRSLRLGGNVGVGTPGAEALAWALAGAPSVRLLDLKGCAPSVGIECQRLSKLLRDAGIDPSCLRL